MTVMPRVVWMCILGLLVASCEDGGVYRLEVSGAFEPAVLDFGLVSIGLTETRRTTLKNTSDAPIRIEDISHSPLFSVRGDLTEATTLNAGAQVDVDITFLAIEQLSLSERLVVRAGELEIPLALVGTAYQQRVAIHEAVPSAVDFGSVTVGETAFRDVVIINRGNRTGQLFFADTSSGGSQFAVDADAWPINIEAQTQTTIRIRFVPADVGSFEDQIVIRSNDVSESITIGVGGRGVTAVDQQVLCTPASLEFGPVERGQSKAVTTTCRASTESVTITGVRIARPFAASADLVGTQIPSTGVPIEVTFVPAGLPGFVGGSMIIDYSGSGGAGSVELPLAGAAIAPTPTNTAVSVVLEWQDNFTDVDLHFLREGGALFDTGDCFFQNRAPSWGAPDDFLDDPYLDVDDIDGFGPETINLTRSAPAQYRVFVHYYADRGQGRTTAEVVLYLDGVEAGRFVRPNLRCNELWDVGTVQWDGMAGTFAPADNVRRIQTGDCD